MLLKTGLKHPWELSLAITEPIATPQDSVLELKSRDTLTALWLAEAWFPVSLMQDTARSLVLFKPSICGLTDEAILRGCCVYINEQTLFGFPKRLLIFFPLASAVNYVIKIREIK